MSIANWFFFFSVQLRSQAQTFRGLISSCKWSWSTTCLTRAPRVDFRYSCPGPLLQKKKKFQKVYTQYCARVMQMKIAKFCLLFFWSFMWKFVGRFSPALNTILPQRVIFLQIFGNKQKFTIKSLGKKKQFSMPQAQSTCHIMSMKQEITNVISWHGCHLCNDIQFSLWFWEDELVWKLNKMNKKMSIDIHKRQLNNYNYTRNNH